MRVEVGPLLAVHLDADEVLVHQRRGRLVLERLALHHVAPVAGRVADAEQDRLLLRARASPAPPRPTATSPPDCARAGAGTDWSRWRDGWPSDSAEWSSEERAEVRRPRRSGYVVARQPVPPRTSFHRRVARCLATSLPAPNRHRIAGRLFAPLRTAARGWRADHRRPARAAARRSPVDPIRDAATCGPIAEATLRRPAGDTCSSRPVSAVLDTLTLLSLRQHIALLRHAAPRLGALVVVASAA